MSMLRGALVLACLFAGACSSADKKKAAEKEAAGELANMQNSSVVALADEDYAMPAPIDDIPHVDGRSVSDQVTMCAFATRAALEDAGSVDIPADMARADIQKAQARWQKRLLRVLSYQTQYPSEDSAQQKAEEAQISYSMQTPDDRHSNLLECVTGLD